MINYWLTWSVLCCFFTVSLIHGRCTIFYLTNLRNFLCLLDTYSFYFDCDYLTKLNNLYRPSYYPTHLLLLVMYHVHLDTTVTYFYTYFYVLSYILFRTHCMYFYEILDEITTIIIRSWSSWEFWLKEFFLCVLLN